MLFHFLGQDLFSKDFFTKENHLFASYCTCTSMTARLLVLIPRIKYYFQCVESTFYKGKSILIQTWALSETVDKLCLCS